MSKEALQIAEKRKDTQDNGEKERYTHLNAEFQRIAMRDKKAFLSDQCKETEENNRMGQGVLFWGRKNVTRKLLVVRNTSIPTSISEFCLS